MQIRRAVREDIPRLIELLYQVHKVHSDKRPDIFKPGSKKYTESQLEEILSNENRPVFVAGDGRVEGYAFCVFQPHTGESLVNYTSLYIDDLCVDEKSRGRHIGTELYNHVLDFARKNGCYDVTLNVWSCNENALKFYQSLGMTVQKMGMEQIL